MLRIACRFPLAAALALAGGCAHVTSTVTPSPPRVVPFSATSMRSIYGVQTTLDGTMSVLPDWIDVTVTSGSLRTLQASPEMYWDLRIRAALATCPDSGAREWDVRTVSPPLRTAERLGIQARTTPSDTSTRPLKDTLSFALAVPRRVPSDKLWMGFVLEWPFENTLATYFVSARAPFNSSGSSNCGTTGAPRKR